MIGSSLQTIPFDSCSIGKEYLATHELDDIATRHADLCALCEQATTNTATSNFQLHLASQCISYLSPRHQYEDSSSRPSTGHGASASHISLCASSTSQNRWVVVAPQTFFFVRSTIERQQTHRTSRFPFRRCLNRCQCMSSTILKWWTNDPLPR